MTFEIIGMLARTLHITDRCFRFLPNPTIFPWDGNSVSLRRLLRAYSDLVAKDHTEMVGKQPKEVEGDVKSDIEKIKQLVDCSKELYGNVGQTGHLTYRQLNDVHDAIDLVDDIIKEGEKPSTNQKVVMDVLRCHLQEVLGAINTDPRTGHGKQAASFHNLLELPPEKRERSFMETYFKQILEKIRHPTDTEQGQVSREIHKENEGRRQSILVHSPIPTRMGESAPSSPNSLHADSPTKPPAIQRSLTPTPGLAQNQDWSSAEDTGKKGEETQSWTETLQTKAEMQRVKIWYALVFRMICWLILHDFDKKDIQVPSSDLMGNRQPVFIT